MGHVSRVHSRQAIFGLDLSKLLLRCDVLQENQDAFLIIVVDGLPFDVECLIRVHPLYSHSSIVGGAFLNHANEAHNLSDLFGQFFFVVFVLIQTHGVLLVVGDLVLSYNFEFAVFINVRL